MQPTHKLYIDDSGTKEYSPTGNYAGGGGASRYFVFGGLLLRPDQAGYASSRLKFLKNQAFGTDRVEIKANWLRYDRERRRRYLDRFGLQPQALRAFVDSIYRLLAAELDCMMVAALVDKVQMRSIYGQNAWYPPAVAYECLLQRVQMEMYDQSGLAHVTVDDMSGATPKGNQYKTNLIRHHKRLRTRGSALQRGFVMDRIGGQKFSDSAADERLQLADLVAYAVYRQFVDHGDAWDTEESALPAYEYLSRVWSRFRNNNGIVAGYGLVKFPMVAKKHWGFQK